MKLRNKLMIMGPLVFFLVISAIFVLHGCGRPKTTTGKITTLSFGVQADTIGISFYNKIIADFEKKHPNIKIVPMYVPGGDYYSKVLAMFASNTAPDVFWMGQGFGDFAQRGCLLELEDAVAPELLKKIISFAPEVLNLYKYKGKLMGMPTGINVALLYYNASLFDKAGFKYPDGNWNTDDLITAAKALTKDTNGDGKTDQYGILITSPAFFLNSFGGSILSRDGKRCELNSRGSIEALTFVRDLTTKYNVSPKQAGGSIEGFMGQEPFLTGRIGMIIMLDNHLEQCRKSIRNFKWDIAPIPCKTKKRYWASSSGFCVSYHTKSKKEAATFVQYLAADPDAQMILGRMAIPVLKDVAEKIIAETTVPRHMVYLLEIIKDINPMPRIAGINQVENIAKTWEEKALLGVVSPGVAYREAAKEISFCLQGVKKNQP